MRLVETHYFVHVIMLETKNELHLCLRVFTLIQKIFILKQYGIKIMIYFHYGKSVFRRIQKTKPESTY